MEETSTGPRPHVATQAVVVVPAVAAIEAGDGTAALPTWVDHVTALGPVIVLLGALVAAVLAWSATRRDRWWARTQWAVDHVLGGDADAQVVALAVLEVQVRHARSAEEAGVIGAVSDTLLEPLLTGTPPDGDDATRYVVRPARPRATALARSAPAPSAPAPSAPAPSAPGPSAPASSAPAPSARPGPGPGAGSGVAGVVAVSAVERDAARLRARVDARLGRTPSPTVALVARAGPD